MLLPFQGATAPTRDTQGVASLALGYVFHWAFSPPLLNPKFESEFLEHPFKMSLMSLERIYSIHLTQKSSICESKSF